MGTGTKTGLSLHALCLDNRVGSTYICTASHSLKWVFVITIKLTGTEGDREETIYCLLRQIEAKERTVPIDKHLISSFSFSGMKGYTAKANPASFLRFSQLWRQKCLKVKLVWNRPDHSDDKFVLNFYKFVLNFKINHYIWESVTGRPNINFFHILKSIETCKIYRILLYLFPTVFYLTLLLTT